MGELATADASSRQDIVDPLSHADAWLTIGDLERLTRLHRRTIYRKVKAGAFPKPFELGANTSRWRLSDYQEWSKARTPH